jgi:putative membrane protein
MLIVACIAAALAAVVHGWIFVLETLRWEADATRRIFGTSREQAAASRQLAANQGVYNLLLGFAALVGVLLVAAGAADAGLAVALTACAVMLGAAAYLVGSDRRKARPALAQGAFPLLAVVAGIIALLG